MMPSQDVKVGRSKMLQEWSDDEEAALGRDVQKAVCVHACVLGLEKKILEVDRTYTL